jgi:hypothetical protein
MNQFLKIFYFIAISLGVAFIIWYFFFSETEVEVTDANNETGFSTNTIGNVTSNIISQPSNFGFETSETNSLFGNEGSAPVYVQASSGEQLLETK